MKDLVELGIWNEELKNEIIANKGSVQALDEVPAQLKALYKTVWEIRQKTIIDMAADRGAFIDQSHSLNIHLAEPTYASLTSMHFYGWKKVGVSKLCLNDLYMNYRIFECYSRNTCSPFLYGILNVCFKHMLYYITNSILIY